jgi:hypothetical protein
MLRNTEAMLEVAGIEPAPYRETIDPELADINSLLGLRLCE